MNRLISEFKNKGIVDITQFISPLHLNLLNNDTLLAFNSYAKRKDFLSKYGNGTPRNMNTVNKDNIDNSSQFIKNFYHNARIQQRSLSSLSSKSRKSTISKSKNLLKVLTTIAQDEVKLIDYDPEKYVINSLNRKGDTHGWHRDNYSYAVIYVCRTPNVEYGGQLETIPDCDSKGLQEVLSTRKINTKILKKNSLYFMESINTFHRVSPLKDHSFRLTLVFSYASNRDLIGDGNMKRISDLYD